MSKPPTCDTPGCGKPIPKGGEGHPEICPTCLYWMQEVDKARSEGVKETRERLLHVAQRALKHRKKAETNGAARIAWDFCANEYLDTLLAEILPPGGLLPLEGSVETIAARLRAAR